MNKYNPNIHHRRSIRLKGYDYSQAGLYFITICTQNRKHLFGTIENGEMILNDAGKMVKNEWLALPKRFLNIKLHEYTVMPNHFHAILEITVGGTTVGATVGATLVVAPDAVDPPKNKTVGDIIGAFKSIVTVNYIRGVKKSGWKPFNKRLWQRNYWESIIRNEKSYHNRSEYIKNNPRNWDKDKFRHKEERVIKDI